MAHAVIPIDNIREVLKRIMENYHLAAPVRENGNLVFSKVSKAADVMDIVLDDELPYKSPKEFLFPQVEELMTFGSDGEPIVPFTPPMTVLFGVKPCDLEAIKIMTAVFTGGKYVDTYFQQRLDRMIIIGMECQSEKKGCFCEERGINRRKSADCDIFLGIEGGNYSMQLFSHKGKILLEAIGLEVIEQVGVESNYACEAERELEADREVEASGAIEITGAAEATEATKSTKATGTGSKPLLEICAEEDILFSKIDWDRITEKCMGCGTCTYICPTCHCFEFKDTVMDGKAARYRCWDSCMYPKFTLHASGHNPRQAKKDRYRQRVLHKYVYIKKNFGYTACTGCGRCIRSCPAGMNIKSVVSGIMEELKK